MKNANTVCTKIKLRTVHIVYKKNDTKYYAYITEYRFDGRENLSVIDGVYASILILNRAFDNLISQNIKFYVG